jgi:hypothetical protein
MWNAEYRKAAVEDCAEYRLRHRPKIVPNTDSDTGRRLCRIQTQTQAKDCAEYRLRHRPTWKYRQQRGVLTLYSRMVMLSNWVSYRLSVSSLSGVLMSTDSSDKLSSSSPHRILSISSSVFQSGNILYTLQLRRAHSMAVLCNSYTAHSRLVQRR